MKSAFKNHLKRRSNRDVSRLPETAFSGQAMARVLDRVSDAVVSLDKEWRYTYVNEQAAQLFGRRPEDLIGKQIWTVFPDDVSQPFHGHYERAFATQQPVFFEDYHVPWGRWFETRVYPSPEGLSIFFHDITDRKNTGALVAGQKQMHEMLATGAPLGDTLVTLARLIEAQSLGTLCSILLLDDDGIHIRHGASPSLPAHFTRSIDGECIGPCAGSCGTAMFRREPVVVEDIATDPLWDDYRALAQQHGLRACWATPIFDAQHRVLGSFALYSRAPGRPADSHLKLIETATHAAAIAIARHREERALRASEARVRNIFEQASDGIFLITADNRYLDANVHGCEMLGYTREELLRMSVADVLAPAEIGRLAVEPVEMMSGKPHLAEWEHRRKDGSIFPAEVSARRLDDKSYLAIVRDLTARKQAEAEMRKSFSTLELFIDSVPHFIAFVDVEEHYQLVNRNYEEWFGRPREQILGRTLRELHRPATYAAMMPHVRQALAGHPSSYENRMIGRDGKEYYFDVRLLPRRAPDGAMLGYFVLALDVTERKQAETQLRKREHQLSALIRNLPGVVFRVRNDPNYTVEYVSDQIAELTGYPADDFRENRRNFGELMHPDDREWVWKEIQQALGDHRPYEVIYRFTDAHGQERWNWERGTGSYDANGELQVVEGFIQDITARKLAETAIRESEARLRLSVEAANVGLWDWDLKTNHIYYSPEWKSQIGYHDEEISNDFNEWESRVHPEDLEPVLRATRAFIANPQGRFETEFRFRHKDGSYRWIYAHGDVLRDADGRPVRMLGSHIDITQRKRAEEQLQQQLAELRRWYGVAIGREERVLELKREVNDLLRQLGQPARYENLPGHGSTPIAPSKPAATAASPG